MVTGVNEKIEEAGPGDVAGFHQRIVGQRIDDAGGEIAGRQACAFGQDHGNVAGEITVTGILGRSICGEASGTASSTPSVTSFSSASVMSAASSAFMVVLSGLAVAE